MKQRHWNPENSTVSKVLSALDDIQYLEPGFTTQVDQIETYMVDLINQPRSSDSFDEKKIACYIKDAIRKKIFNELVIPGVQEYSLDFIGHNSLRFLSSVEKNLRLCFQILSAFKVRKRFAISLEENHLYFSMLVTDVMSDKKTRQYIRSLNRAFLKAGILPTFQVCSTKTEYDRLLFDFDFSYEKNQVLDLFFAKNCALKVPKIFSSYQLKTGYDAPSLKHIVLQVDRDLDMKIFNKIPSNWIDENSRVMSIPDYSLFHFPFLFRPVSIIIPDVDTIFCDDSDLSDYDENSTGSVMVEKIKFRKRLVFGHIDFFKFF